jgi:hypothetical protein
MERILEILEILEKIREEREDRIRIKIKTEDEKRRMIVYINGSCEIEDYMSVINSNIIRYKEIEYHEGVVIRYKRLKKENKMEEIYEKIREYNKKGYKIEMVGHSLGGGLIVLLGYELYRREKIKSRIYTIGCFRVIRERGMLKELEIYRIINKEDVVRKINNKRLKNIGEKIEVKNVEKSEYNHSIEDYIRNIRKMINK